MSMSKALIKPVEAEKRKEGCWQNKAAGSPVSVKMKMRKNEYRGERGGVKEDHGSDKEV